MTFINKARHNMGMKKAVFPDKYADPGDYINQIVRETPSFSKYCELNRRFQEFAPKLDEIKMRDRATRDFAVLLVSRPLKMYAGEVRENIDRELYAKTGIIYFAKSLHGAGFGEIDGVYAAKEEMEHPKAGKYTLIEPIWENNQRSSGFSSSFLSKIFIVNGRLPDYFCLPKYRKIAKELRLSFPEGHIFHESNHLEMESIIKYPETYLKFLFGFGSENARRLGRLVGEASEIYAYLGNARHQAEEAALRALSFIEMRPIGHLHRTAMEKLFRFIGAPIDGIGPMKDSDELKKMALELSKALSSSCKTAELKAGFGFPAVISEMPAEILNFAKSLRTYLDKRFGDGQAVRDFIHENFPEHDDFAEGIVRALNNVLGPLGKFNELLGIV